MSITEEEEEGFLGILGLSREKKTKTKRIKHFLQLFLANPVFLPPASCEAEGSKHSRLVMTMILRSRTATQEAGRKPMLA